MAKLITDAGKRGDDNTLKKRIRKRYKRQLEEDPTLIPQREGIKKLYGWEGKSDGYGMNPLENYLGKQVGKLWNDIYSEITEHLDSRSNTDRYLLDHLDWLVTMQGDPIPTYGFWRQLYIDDDGYLQRSPKRKRQQKEKPINTVYMDGNEYHKIDEQWYKIEFAPPTNELHLYDSIKRKLVEEPEIYHWYILPRRHYSEQKIIGKKQIGGKELKELKKLL